VLAAALVVAVAAVRSFDDPAPAPPPRLDAQDVERIARRVERLRDLRFTRPVRPLFLDREEAVEVLARVGRREYPLREQRVDEESAKLLGLLAPRASLSRVLERVDQEQVLGFYDDRAKRLVVIRDAGARRPLLELTLAHELVHALEDQRYGFDLPEGVRSDRVLAEAALAEGSATAVMADYAQRHLRLADVLSVAEAAEGAAFPEYIERQLLFPYLAGQEFVSVLRGETGGWAAVDSVYRLRRPQTTEQVIHPRRFAAGEAAARVPVPRLRGVLPKPWRRLRSTSVGEFDLQMLFKLNRARRPARAAAGWGGGRFELWRRPAPGCAAPCVRADLGWIGLRWDTPAERAEGEAALRTAVARWRGRGGAVALAGSGVRTTVALAPDARTARAALAAGAGRG
jgi:hypothetical protein